MYWSSKDSRSRRRTSEEWEDRRARAVKARDAEPTGSRHRVYLTEEIAHAERKRDEALAREERNRAANEEPLDPRALASRVSQW